ncbi:NADH:flavin oxidoreductase [Marinicella rhabdoformis]|uniref:NADH:flavin oxidoreductase n=1 Tax=Marinicella rhabdoformis TaxID=2580566 RepID=UPI0012AEBA51|nr:NADH:flavin oxidoreductase [Marinicella rhabdoformis]
MKHNTEKSKRVWQPSQILNLKIKNRVVMAPMTRSFSPGHTVTEDAIAYYRRRAENGVGLIITEGTCVGVPEANGYPDVPFIAGEAALAGWKKVVDAVHEVGGKIMPQLWHVGAVRKQCLQPDESVPAYSPSGLLGPGKPHGVAMTLADIKRTQDAFVQAAIDAKSIGFDGVELHGAHGYLIDQFFWQGTNTRDDQYGGDVLGRTRFACEIVKRIKAEAGEDFPVILRFSQWKLQNYEIKLAETPESLAAFLAPLVDAGVDVFHCSSRRFWEPEFEGSDLNLAAWTQKLSGKPCITVGSVGLDDSFVDEKSRDIAQGSKVSTDKLAQLEKNIESCVYDFVAVGRSVLHDPEWVGKWQQGAFSEMKPYTAKALQKLY